MSCECAVKILELLGLFVDNPAGDGATGVAFTLMKLVFTAVDIASSALDWQVAFRLARGDYQLISDDVTEELSSNIVAGVTAGYVCILVLSHVIFIRGKWFYLENVDWAAYAITEIVHYAIEDVATIFLFLFTKGFFDPDSFIDRFNVILSNISGYFVILMMWARLLSSCCGGGDRAPCSAYALPIWVTIESVLISILSFRTIFQQIWAVDYGEEGQEDMSAFDFVIVCVAGGWAGVAFFWIIIFLFRWPKCLRWAASGNGDDHSYLGFTGVWTVVFGVTIFFGWALTQLQGEKERDWLQSFSEMVGEVQPGGSGSLKFGHIVDWGREGDLNGYGSTLIIGAVDPSNHTTGYTASADLCDPPCIGDWTVESTVLGEPFCSYPYATAGFKRDINGTYSGFLRKTVYYRKEYRYGPSYDSSNGFDGESGVSIASAGSDYYDATTGVDPTPNAMRIVVGYSYPNDNSNYTRGLVQAHRLYEYRYRTGGFTNTARGMDQIGQDIVPGDDMSSFGDQISMGALNNSRFVATAVRNGIKVVLLFEYNDAKNIWVRARATLDISMVDSDETLDLESFCESIELSGDGNRIVVGFPGALSHGAVYIFEWSGSSWEQVGNVIRPSMYPGMSEVSSFGYAVTVNEKGGRIAAAGEADDSSFVLVFELDDEGTWWSPLGSSIKGEGGNRAAKYRHSLSLDRKGNFIAVGGVGTKDSEGLGRVRVFKYTRIFGW